MWDCVEGLEEWMESHAYVTPRGATAKVTSVMKCGVLPATPRP